MNAASSMASRRNRAGQGCGMSRIMAGTAGGMPLVSVPGSMTRPTTDRVKEALFSRLDAFNVLAGSRAFWTSTPVPVRWAWRAPAGARKPSTSWNSMAKPATSASGTRT